jgi:hypothetical protein
MLFDISNNVYFIARHITVSGTGDKQKGFCRKGLNFKASKDTLNILRGFFAFKGYSFNRSFLYRLRVDKRMEQQKQALSPLTTCTMTMVKYSGSWPFLHHVSNLGIPNALIVGMRQMSILTLYMGGDYRSWRKG